MINNQADPSEGASIELAFSEHEDEGLVDYRLVRTWRLHKSRVREQMDVYVDGKPDKGLADNWDEVVERFLPQKLCNLFFFDGEQIETLADPDKSHEILQTAISSLLGLELVDQLMVDLRAAKRAKLKSDGADTDRSRLEEVEEHLRDLNAFLETKRTERGELSQKLGQAKNALERARLKYERQGGDLLGQMKDLERQKYEAESSVQILQEELRKLASGALPLGLVEPQLQQLMETAGEESLAKAYRASQQLIENRDKEILEWLDEKGLEKPLKKSFSAMLTRKRTTAAKQADETIKIDLSERGLHQAHALLQHDLDEAANAVSECVTKLNDLYEQISGLERELARVPEEASLTEVVTQLERAKIEHRQLEERAEALDQEVAELENKQADFEKKQTEIEAEIQLTTLRGEFKERVLATADTMTETMKRFRQTVLERHLGRLESFIYESYKALLRKQGLISEIRICPKTLALTVHDLDKSPIDPARLSAGERQLLATSILWGLAKASGRALPVVIDTPLGRLDGSHRDRLVEHYFPNASHQVILLSTDEEIDRRYYQKLSPSVAGEFEIFFDETRGGSGVRAGYPFEEAA
jgi:DNA sulfur modification protein DndD